MEQPAKVEVTRQELYDLVWSTAMRLLAPRFGLSDVGLAKICEHWNIPRPPRGYWAKKAHGHKVQQAKLPPIKEGNPVVLRNRPGASPVREAGSTDAPKPQTERQRRQVEENKAENRIAVATDLTDPHPLVARTERSLRSATPNEVGLARPKAQRCLDVTVSPAQIDRALRLLDTLVKALEARGFPVKVTDGEHPRTVARVLGEDIGFQLYEEVDRHEREPTQEEWERSLGPFSRERTFYVQTPSGKLALHITDGTGLRRTWTDRSDRRVEGFLNAFVVGLVGAAETVKEARAEYERREQARQEAQRQWQEQERRRWEEERLRKEEEARLAKLEAQADAWRRAQLLRQFLAAVRAEAEARDGQIVPGGELERWLAWVARKANTLDPLPRLPPNRPRQGDVSS
jgi:hypothetical protein